MDIQGLEQEKWHYEDRKAALSNAEVQISNALMYLNHAKEVLGESYKINDSLEDDGDIKYIIGRLEGLKRVINIELIPYIDQQISSKEQEIIFLSGM